jgi:UDP-N-acetylmuramoylalanine--D-glutamate ligase
VAERITSAAELGTLEDVRTAGAGVLAVHNIANALAAATLARGFGVLPAAVRDGLRGYLPLPHRLNPVALTGGVTWIDDSAATDPAAAAAGLSSFEPVVWVAGGALADPGHRDRIAVDLEELVLAHVGRLRAVVLVGPDRAILREALQRHAPDVPVVEVDVAETGAVPVMEVVVARAGQFAQPGDTVLLSPGFAADPGSTLDERGLSFVRAVLDRPDRPETAVDPAGETD